MIRGAVIATVGLLVSASPALAHKLEMACRFLPGWRIQIEGWYEGGGPASGARVKVTQGGGQLVADGRIDKNGFCVFPFHEAMDMKIVVWSAGHRAEQTISAKSLTRHIACACAACLAPEPFLTVAVSVPMPMNSVAASESIAPAGSRSEFPLWGVVGGVGILLAVALAFKRRSTRRVNG
jgi:hypothetical protein